MQILREEGSQERKRDCHECCEAHIDAPVYQPRDQAIGYAPFDQLQTERLQNHKSQAIAVAFLAYALLPGLCHVIWVILVWQGKRGILRVLQSVDQSNSGRE